MKKRTKDTVDEQAVQERTWSDQQVTEQTTIPKEAKDSSEVRGRYSKRKKEGVEVKRSRSKAKVVKKET